MADLPDAATCYELLARMALIRRFEEEAGRQYQRAKAGGFLHLAIGEEATIVGTTSVMRDEDFLIGTYRTHGHAIARGTEPKRVMAELFGRVDGTSGGRGGSMHIFDAERRFMGGYGIVGGNLPIAAGLALSSQYKGEDAVTVCMFGDGASNTGNFGETMNLAALWKLPVFFLVENNLYGMGTAVERHSAQTDLSKKAEGYGIPGNAGRRHGRCRRARGGRRRDPRRRARKTARPCSRSSPTATAATPPPTPRSTASARRSSSGARKTRSRASPGAASRPGCWASARCSRCATRPSRPWSRRPSSPRPRRSRRWTRCTRTSTHSTIRAAGTRSTSAARSRTAASARTGCPTRRASWLRPGRRTPSRRTTRGGGRIRRCRATRRTAEPADRDRGRRRGGSEASDNREEERLMAEQRMREALRDAMAEEMRRDEGVFVMGEDVAVFQGAFKVTEGLIDEFGERRVRDTPISENTIVGAGVGAAMGGLRPVVELMTVNFSLLALDQIVNHAAAIPYMFNGQARVPMVIRMPGGGGHQLGPTHSHSFEALYLQVPGLLVACPSTPADGKALLKAAIRDDNPVIFIEHESLYGVKGEVPEGEDEVLRFGEAAVRREGGDVTIVGVLKMAQVAEQAAAKLAEEHGVEAEVIDPRTLRPLDLDTILESVRKTNRAVIVEEGWPHGGVGANMATLITEQAFDDLDAPVQRVTGADVHMPYSKRLEQAAIPHEEHVVSAALATLEGSL